MEGYDVEIIGEATNDFFCVICLKLMCNPVQFRCGHGMCRGCFKRLMKKAQNRSCEIQCPQCREIVRESEVFSNIMIHRLILSLTVKCPNEDCGWEGELLHLQDHEDTHSSDTSHFQVQTKSQSQCSLKTLPLQADLTDSSQLSRKLEALEKKILSRFAQFEKILRTVPVDKHHLNQKQSSHSIFLCFSILLVVVMVILVVSSPLFFNSMKLKKQDFMLKHFRRIFKFETVNTTTVSSQFKHLSKMISSLLTIQMEDIEFCKKDLQIEFTAFEKMQLKSIEEKKSLFQEQLSAIQFKNNQDLLLEQNSVKRVLSSVKNFKMSELDKMNSFESEFLLTRLRKCAALRGRVQRLFDKVNVFRINGYVESNVNSEAVMVQMSDLELRLYELYNYLDETRNREILKYQFALLRGHIMYKLNEYYTNLTGVIVYNSGFEKRNDISLYNVYNVNLIFVWSINCTHMELLKENHAYYSENFAAAGAGKSFLLLYKDKNRPGMWEITYNQNRTSFLYDTFTVSIMNQFSETQLICPESPIGESPKDNIATVTKFFHIPFSQEQMIDQGYIYNDMLYIKCAVD